MIPHLTDAEEREIDAEIGRRLRQWCVMQGLCERVATAAQYCPRVWRLCAEGKVLGQRDWERAKERVTA
jgi:hypothetical protein